MTTPTTVEAVCAALRAEAETLLDQAARVRARSPANADTAHRHAMSLALAIGHLNRRAQMTTDTLTTVKPCPRPSCKLDDGHDGICRDRWTKPLVKPPGGAKPVAYFRATKFVDVVEDRYNLEKWQQRQVALGLAVSPDLLLKVAAADPDDREVINDLCEQAQTEAKANVKRDRGTFLHALSEIADAGADLPEYLDLPGIGRMETTDADRSAVMAYVNATRCFTHLHTEALTVVDSLKVAGTPDRISHYVGPGPDGKTPVDWNLVTDLKSGNMDYGQLKTAGQLALYSRAELVDIDTWERSPLPDVRQDWGVIVDLDAEQGTCELRWIDLVLGWEVVEEAARVRALRRRDRTAFRPFVLPEDPNDLAAQLAAAPDVQHIADIKAAHLSVWLPEHSDIANRRYRELTGAVA